MKWIKDTLIFAVCTIAILVICTSSNADKYEMVRQGSVGEAVQRVQLRLRDLDYLHFKPTGGFKGMTVSATIAFQQMQVTDDGGWVAADGEAGEQTQSILFSTRARRASISATAHMPIGPSLSGTAKVKGTIVAWNTVKEKLKSGNVYKIFDYNTGKSFKVIYAGGESHAEVECATAADTLTFLAVFGGEFNFSKRAMVLQLDSDTLIAASMIGDPHGNDTVKDNDMGGHVCLFFDGSRAHVGNVTDVEHQKQVYAAAGM